MRRLLVALCGVVFAAGCASHESSPPPEEMSRDRARVIVRDAAAEVVREQFGVLPAPQREYETNCDSARWWDDDRVYVMHGVWELPMPSADQERVLRAFHDSSGRFGPMWTPLGGGRFAVDGFDGDKGVSFTLRSGDSPDVLRVWAGSRCLRDPD